MTLDASIDPTTRRCKAVVAFEPGDDPQLIGVLLSRSARMIARSICHQLGLDASVHAERIEAEIHNAIERDWTEDGEPIGEILVKRDDKPDDPPKSI